MFAVPHQIILELEYLEEAIGDLLPFYSALEATNLEVENNFLITSVLCNQNNNEW